MLENPYTYPAMHRVRANRWVLVSAFFFMSVTILSWQCGHVVGIGSGPTIIGPTTITVKNKIFKFLWLKIKKTNHFDSNFPVRMARGRFPPPLPFLVHCTKLRGFQRSSCSRYMYISLLIVAIDKLAYKLIVTSLLSFLFSYLTNVLSSK